MSCWSSSADLCEPNWLLRLQTCLWLRSSMRAADLHRLTCVSQTGSLGCTTCFWLSLSMRAVDLHRLTCVSQTGSLGCMICFWLRPSMRIVDLHRLTCVSQTGSLDCTTCFWLRSSMPANLCKPNWLLRLHDLLLAEVVNANR